MHSLYGISYKLSNIPSSVLVYLSEIAGNSNTNDIVEIMDQINNGPLIADVSDPIEIMIGESTEIIISELTPVCFEDSPFPLQAEPLGVTCTGTGVDLYGVFDPFEANIGDNLITYNFINEFGCESTDSAIQIVIPPMVIAIDEIPSLCWSENNYQINASLSGGIWSGDASPTGSVDQANGVGSYSAVYNYIEPVSGCIYTNEVNWEVVLCNNADAGNLLPFSLQNEAIEICEGDDAPGFSQTYQSNGVEPSFGNYAYAFILVNQFGTIEQVKIATGDFDLEFLLPGTYFAYGLSYSEDLNSVPIVDYLDAITNINEVEVDISNDLFADLTNELPNGDIAQLIVHEDPTVNNLSPNGLLATTDIVFLNGTPMEGTTPFDNAWWTGDNVSNDGSFDASIPGSFEVTYHYLSQFGCSSSDIKTINVWSGGNGGSIEANSQNICLGETVELEVSFPSFPIDGVLTIDGVGYNILANTTSFQFSDTPLQDQTYVLESFILDDGTNMEYFDQSTVNIDPINPEVVCSSVSVTLVQGQDVSVGIDDLTSFYGDNCEVLSIEASQSVFSEIHEGNNDVEVTIFDNNGNSNSCMATVDVTVQLDPDLDITPPTVSLNNTSVIRQCSSLNYQELIEFENGTMSVSAQEDLIDQFVAIFNILFLAPTVSDDSDTADLVIEGMEVQTTGLDCPEVMRITISYSAIDGSGNVSLMTVSPYISMIDDVAPVISGLSSSVSANSPADIPIPSGDEIATDCTFHSVSHIDQVIEDTDCGYTLERTYSAIDLCNNESSFVQTIDVIDYEDPTNLNSQCSNNTGILLEWDVDPGTVACQIQGGLVGGVQEYSVKYAPNVSQHFAPLNSLDLYAEYQWRVRCACDLDPVTATAFTPYTYFVVRDLCFASMAEGGDENGTTFHSPEDEILKMEIFPNPSSDVTTLELIAEESRSGLIMIYNVLGDIVHRHELDLQSGMNRISLDLSVYNNGTYLVEFKDMNGERISKRLVILK